MHNTFSALSNNSTANVPSVSHRRSEVGPDPYGRPALNGTPHGRLPQGGLTGAREAAMSGATCSPRIISVIHVTSNAP